MARLSPSNFAAWRATHPRIAGGEHQTVEELESRQTEIRSRLGEIDSQFAGQALPDEQRTEWNELNEELDTNDTLIQELRARQDRVRSLAGDPASREDGATFHTPRPSQARGEDIYDLSTVRSSVSNPTMQAQELRDRAMRSVEASRPRHPDIDPDQARSNVERLVDEKDSEDGRFSRYILATGSPAYKRAFGKYLASGNENGMSREEQAAWHMGQSAERALSLTAANGGYAVPYELDPTILNTSNGVVNPIRQIARVEQITVDEWRGVTSAGITASYAAEATETTDNAPTLAQPTVSTEKAQAFVPFSIEAGQDWTGLQSQMAVLLADAKDTLEAGKFITGTGTNEPFGVAVGTTNTVAAVTGLTMNLSNLYSLMAALPPRYRARASFIGDLAILNRIRQFDTVGSSAAIWVDSLQDDVAARLLGKGVYEASEMPETITNGAKILIFGDFSRYLIVDRVGLTIEVIPHLMGANGRPTGQRGLYAYWRNGAKVLDANAFRAMTGTT